MSQALDVDRRWFKRFGRADPPDPAVRVRLLCFHHAGGSAGTYRRWRPLLPPWVELVAVQLPGRADRFGEPAHDRMTALVDDLVEVLDPLTDLPFACFGVSMGSRVAWAVAHELRDRGLPEPVTLFLACDPAPALDDGTWPWQDRTDGLPGYLREMGGTPQEVLDQPEMLAALLPALRNDLTVLETHDVHPGRPLTVPVHAFAAVDDTSLRPERMEPWRTETTGPFALHRLPGGHFLTPEAERAVIDLVVADLARTTGT